MALTKSRGVDILTPDGNSLASFIDVNDGKWKLKDVNGNVDEAQSYISGGGGGDGVLQTANAFSVTLQNVKDGVGNASILNIATNQLEVLATDTNQTPFGVKSITTGGGIYLMDSTTTNSSSVNVEAIGNDMILVSGGSNRVRLFSNGNFVIGNALTDAGYKLHVEATDAQIHGVRIGRGAGSLVSNTVVGNTALSSITTGTNNTAVGSNALQNASTSNFNTAVGFEALLNVTTATGSNGYNTALGYQAGRAITTGTANLAIGDRSMIALTTGRDNIAIGSRALSTITSTAENVAIGLLALNSHTGSSTTAIGSYSLRNNTASNNTAFGFESGLTNVSGTGLTAIGYQALRASTANNNTALGFQAGLIVSTGQANTIIGSLAGSSLTTGSSNTFIGASANTTTIGGSSNTIIGASSTIGGANNTNAVGIGASISSRDSGVTIGASASGGQSGVVIGQSATSGNQVGCIVLGQGATANGANQFVVGSTTQNAGAVVGTGDIPCTFTWAVKINGTDYRILMTT